MAGRVALLDLNDPRAPRVTKTIDSVPGYRRPHTFARLPNGNVIVTLQFGNGSMQGDPGGIAELDQNGNLLRVTSSADPAFPQARIRTYGLEVLPNIDRAITTSSPMDDEVAADRPIVVGVEEAADCRTQPERRKIGARDQQTAAALVLSLV